MSIEEQIWSTEATQPRVESARDRIAIVQPIPDNFYDRCTAHQITHCMVCAMKERAAAQPTPTSPASQTVVAQPVPFLSGAPAATPSAKPDPDSHAGTILTAAQTLAEHIQASHRLKNKIVGLEAALGFARSELATTEVTKAAAKDALRKIVTEEEA